MRTGGTARFLQELMDAGRPPSILGVCVSAIAASHAPIAAHSLGKSDLIVCFLKGARRFSPPCPYLGPYLGPRHGFGGREGFPLLTTSEHELEAHITQNRFSAGCGLG